MALDEMVDGKGGLRPQWRSLLAVLTELTHETLADRADRLGRTAEEEGITGVLPGAAPDPWRFDPVPLPLPQSEFAVLETGLAQRARLLDALLADVYGPQRVLAEGALPPPLVFANPGFLRPCHDTEAETHGRLQFYAADLVRGPDGAWRVLADRTGWPEGLAHALENRRRLGRVLPELFPSQLVCQLDPFIEVWQDALQRSAPVSHHNGGLRAPGGVAMLTPGHADPSWFGHVLLARELSCALVEGGDLSVRDGGLFLKTLRGLQPIGVLLRALDGRMVDPLELAAEGAGVPGLLDTVRGGSVRIVNDPGSAFAEIPAMLPFLPALAERLLGERLELPSVPTAWMGDTPAREAVLRVPEGWLLRSAFDRNTPPVALSDLPEAELIEKLGQLAAKPWAFAATARMAASMAPCLGPQYGPPGLVPRPVIMRVFLAFDGTQWRAMQGGLGCALPDGAPIVWPRTGPRLEKDVWVLADTPSEIVGAPAAQVPPLPIRRAAGDLPSRAADDFFWLGRYLERMEGAARLLRASITRLSRPTPTPHEAAELGVLVACLEQAGLLNAETIAGLGRNGLTEEILKAASGWGAIHALLGRVSRLAGLVRDRVTGEMYAVIARGLRNLEGALQRIPASRDSQALDAAKKAMTRVLVFAATVAGLAAENMVRGGGRLFLDLGRRVERAQAVADELACALEFDGPATQPAQVEHGLRLALELRDSVITYRSRYLAVLQPAPALDLILADEGNPRGFAFQIIEARALLVGIGGTAESSLVSEADALLAEAGAIVHDVAQSLDQARAALRLPARIRALSAGVAELSDHLSRRYFALLPVAQSVGLSGMEPSMQGAA
jgi:uncharacterized circularly permuted ATP-grasp superfamily protein/uncharacterized alpha-E superfamily protein